MTVLALRNGEVPIRMDVRTLVVAGFTGRDDEAVRRHIDELREAGVSTPDQVPAFWVLPHSLVTTAERIGVSSDETSGEVEPVLFLTGQGAYVGVGSDHTDRLRERSDIADSKAACPKAVGRTVHRLEDLSPVWDDLVLRSWVDDVLYQQASLRELLPVETILSLLGADLADNGPGTVLFCGTVPLITGSFRFSETFRCELAEPGGGTLSGCSYRVTRR